MKTYTATVQTNVTGSARTAEFTVDEAELEGLDADDRDELLMQKAYEAVFGNGLVEIYYDEGDDE